MDWIRRYAVVQMDDNPMYGRDLTLEVFETYAEAVTRARALSVVRRNLCVIERMYASVANLKKGITFDSHIRWASWLDGYNTKGAVLDEAGRKG